LECSCAAADGGLGGLQDVSALLVLFGDGFSELSDGVDGFFESFLVGCLGGARVIFAINWRVIGSSPFDHSIHLWLLDYLNVWGF